MRGVSVFLVLFTLAFTTGWSSSGSLPFIQCFILFSQFILVCFIICKNEIMILWPPWVRVWGWASYWFLPFTVFSLGLPFCFSSYIVHLRCTSEGGSLDVYRTSHSFFVWGSLWVSVALLCCCHCWVGCIVYWRILCVSSLCPVARWHYLPPRSFQNPAFAPLLTDITCPLVLFRKCCCFLSLFCFFFTMHSFFFTFGLLAISYPLVSLPD